jgi:hypothetical protein
MTDEMEAIRSKLTHALREDPPVVSWKVDATRLIAFNLAICVLVVAAAFPWQPAHSGDWIWWLGAVALVALIVAGSALAIAPSRRTTPWIAVVLAVVSVFLIIGNAHTSRDVSLLNDAECALAEVGVSLVPAVLTTLALERFAFKPLRAWVGGIAASATGALVLHCTCENVSASHVIMFHLAPGALVAIVLMTVRARMKSRSFAP